MPFAELADAIVQSGRKTLENAIQLVETSPMWNARVLYGDTDSLFVYLKNKSVAEAFSIGHEIASTVTKQNPFPVELRMEKVYCPCCLVSKKRYVGMAYTHPEDTPHFDAKGIEAIRQDQCAATTKMMETALKILFSSKDLSLLKRYLLRQWQKILNEKISIMDFIFYKQCKLGSYSAEQGGHVGTLPPQAAVAYKMMSVNAVNAPERGERIPLVFSEKLTGNRLVNAAVPPDHVTLGWKPLLSIPYNHVSESLLEKHQFSKVLEKVALEIQFLMRLVAVILSDIRIGKRMDCMDLKPIVL
ncbi:Dna polymerase family B protein [Cardiosporidium cionae]|uniref:DNA-directed DNA polymerase n=1 Tax=Cardiosporidium cionae TaxID=476202 RepID=A0ABQ7JD41_9APIC|nr:Dna polymerase family B protein [Cardiosporidium cionae]|eukprot:KAF8821545.1 Dna polymerase family B protein [Cardiosporidium cionae]